MTDHLYREGLIEDQNCVVCGGRLEGHPGIIIEQEMTREEFARRYPASDLPTRAG